MSLTDCLLTPARLTGDECAAVVLGATQLEVFQTQVDHEDGTEKTDEFSFKMMNFVFKMVDWEGYASYYQGLSDAVAACFVSDSDNTDEDDQVRVDCCLLCIYMPVIDRSLSDCRSRRLR